MSELLRMKGIEKSFPGVKALSGVDLELNSGELLALVGENGAGKSTLMKVLAGVHQPDTGDIFIKGEHVGALSPEKSEGLGVSIMYQEFNLFNDLTVAENIYIRREPRKKPSFVIDDKKLVEMSQKVLDRLELKIDPRQKVRNLSVAEQQMVEIAKALSMKTDILVMDEPTAALTESEIEALFKVIHDLKAQGVGIVYISHRLEELDHIADRVMVLRDGQYIMSKKYEDITTDEMIEAMVGRSLEEKFPAYEAKGFENPSKLLEVNSIKRGRELDVQGLDLYQGEILGVYGLMGAGRTELARCIFGADTTDVFDVNAFGKQIKVKSPVDAIEMGIGYLTEDRKKDGLALNQSVEYNISLPSLHQISKMGVVDDDASKKIAEQHRKDLLIKTPSVEQKAQNLSGGNQQKVVIAKWLQRKSKIIIFDEPTRGIDVGAKFEVYELMIKLAKEGVGVIMISSELPEVIGISDRVAVMKGGRLSGTLNREDLTQEKILSLAI